MNQKMNPRSRLALVMSAAASLINGALSAAISVVSSTTAKPKKASTVVDPSSGPTVQGQHDFSPTKKVPADATVSIVTTYTGRPPILKAWHTAVIDLRSQAKTMFRPMHRTNLAAAGVSMNC